MFDYSYDPETGGLLLNDGTPQFSKEPRPVFSDEMRLLHMDEMWQFDFQNDLPYMWAESANYFYRGELVARTLGGSLYEAPKIDFDVRKDNTGKRGPSLQRDTQLLPVDIEEMVVRNTDMMSVIEQSTCKKIYNYYKRNKNKLDCFHVAFSGGKDSIVLLELAYKALRNNFIVVFGDTKMEFPDTYALVDIIEEQCRERKIPFYRAASHFDPSDSWCLFGPPSRVLRWCCTVHKAAPQILKLREILGKVDYVGADFIGVRAAESLKRSEYEFENFGKKQKGQYSQNPILDWTSAEIWMYIFSRNLYVNAAYKKGNPRVGCLFCPMGRGKSDFYRYSSYAREIDPFIQIIKKSVDDKNMDSYIANGGWCARSSGRDIMGNEQRIVEEIKDGYVYLIVKNVSDNWKEWAKTIFHIEIPYDVAQREEGYIVKFPEVFNKTMSGKLLKQVFYKTAYCVGCRACEANCKYGCISFTGAKVEIKNCQHCGQCHTIGLGCYVADCMKKPTGVKKMSINTFDDHAPKPEWLNSFFEHGEKFFDEASTLGPNQNRKFRRFLSDAELIKKNSGNVTNFFSLVSQVGYSNEAACGLMYVKLAYNNPQIRWYIDNMEIDSPCSAEFIKEKLNLEGLSDKDARSVIKAFGRLCNISLGIIMKLGITKGKPIDSLTRTKCSMKDDRVLLYALYRYAETCEDYYEFSLSRLMDVSIESAGISPVKLFGYSEDEMESMLNGLSSKYSEFVNVTFTHGLDKITLRDDKTADDVLTLF